ncbi:hypothetical protein [Polyangium sp. 6x1]|uniref:hypothetical protein n=1 Tax=Polyangium sp. 6x1 TaxID=3042689 RepID=UPI0024821CE3|nr:hypothetical protein [Polyangium sp. 6x1]MDI1451826.1 hypothetical protein [Polyangium sp. 6x1]
MKTSVALVATLALSTLAAPALAQAAIDPLLTRNLAAVASQYGDANGHLVTTLASGQSVIFARGQGGFVVYTGGDNVYTVDDFAFCVEDSAGGLSSCNPGSGDYECDPTDGECTCSGLWDCVWMILAECTELAEWDGFGNASCSST